MDVTGLSEDENVAWHVQCLQQMKTEMPVERLKLILDTCGLQEKAERDKAKLEIPDGDFGKVAKADIKNKDARKKIPLIKELKKDLPKRLWRKVPHDYDGCQFHTEIRMGSIFSGMMLDTGSGVNTMPEIIVVDVVNYHAHLRFDSAEHPIRGFEEWDEDEYLQGVAAGHPIAMIGQVVMKAHLVECGKTTGPAVLIRFKI